MNKRTSNQPISDQRSQRGFELAQAKRKSITTLIGTKYLVPSANDNGSSYVVDAKAESCTCLDWAQWGGHDRPHRCKHVWAVIYAKELPDGSALIMEEKKPSNDNTRNWKVTNACRTLIPALAPRFAQELVDGLCLQKRGPGAVGTPTQISQRDLILTALIRALEQKTAGATITEVENLRKAGVIKMKQVPSYNTLLREFAKPALMPVLHRLLAGSALPLIGLEDTFAVDGTGFGSSAFDCHHTEKHGPKSQRRAPTKRHRWIGATMVFCVKTHGIVAVQITEQHVAESPLMPELLRRVISNGGHVAKWCGDSAYNSWYNVEAVERAGGEPFFDWRRGVTGKTKPAVQRLYQKFTADQDLYWSQYHKRSLAETGNMMLKTRFGHSLRSRVPHAQYAECMLRCIAHNIACLVMAIQEFNVEPRYWAPELLANLPDFGSTMPPTIEVG